jgi:hypothetical protein
MFLRAANATRFRVEAFVGLFLTSAEILLGIAWPSPYTLVALLMLPAPVVLFMGIVVPSLVERFYILRPYLLVAIPLAATCLLIEGVWFYTHTTIDHGYNSAEDLTGEVQRDLPPAATQNAVLSYAHRKGMNCEPLAASTLRCWMFPVHQKWRVEFHFSPDDHIDSINAARQQP